MVSRANRRTQVLKDLGDGLILRPAARADTDALARFNCDIHCQPGSGEPPRPMAAWIRDLMSGDHPTFKPGDFTIVEDRDTGEIVSSLCLIPQRWRYAGVKFGVGLPELVGTKPAYRRRGLVRAQFDVVHQWSARRKHLAQAVLGIPNFYRQFGYEMALEADAGRMGYAASVPALTKGEKESYRVRLATDADGPFIARVYRDGMARYLVSCVRTPAIWRYELAGRRKEATERRALRVIESAGGERVGFLAPEQRLWGNGIGVRAYELRAQAGRELAGGDAKCAPLPGGGGEAARET
jgi:RimJ/RimL family protein N-acetyltransferase